jgi:hypothetical protein
MPPRAKLEGQRFGHLLVLERHEGTALWRCVCDCGAIKVASTEALRRGRTGSCGCFSSRAPRHHATVGRKKTPEYGIWAAIVQRCTNPSSYNFSYYGGRGIQMCDRWRDSFEAFLQDMGPKPTRLHTIDRLDTNGNYEPGNCRWATRAEQNRNTRRTRLYEINGERLCLTDWCARARLARSTVRKRLAKGQLIQTALGMTS